MRFRKAEGSDRRVRLIFALLTTSLVLTAQSSLVVSSPAPKTQLVATAGFERPWVRNEFVTHTRISTICQGPTFPCDVSLSVTDVDHTSSVAPTDRFKVKMQLTSQSPCFSALVPSQQLISQSLFSANFAVSVKVTRRFGHTDTGFGTGNHSITGDFSIDVEVPRGTLETDPVSVEVNVTMTATLTSKIEARISGNGIPTFSGSQSSNAPGNSAQCYPLVTITGVNYVQGSGAQKDTVTVNWTVAQPQSSCLKLSNVTATAKLKRADGSTGTATSGGNGTATLQVSGNPGNVVSFDVSVLAQAGSSPNVTASAKRNQNF